MNKRKLIILTLSFIGLISVSAILYKTLAQEYKEKNQDNTIVATPESFDIVEDSNLDLITPIIEKITTAPSITVIATPTNIVVVTKTPELTKTTPIPTKTTPAPTKSTPKTPTKTPTKLPLSTNTVTDFTVQDYSGNNVNLSDYFGKPIVMNFWASWCGPCKEEMPVFNRVYLDVKNDVVFLMVDLVDGRRETKQTGYNYISAQGFSFPVYYDINQEAAYAYSVTSIPTTYFIRSDGSLETFQKGAMSESNLRSEITKLLQ